MKLLLSEIARAVGGKLQGKDKIIMMVVTDSRDVNGRNVDGILAAGNNTVIDYSTLLFAALRGERIDGHIFVKEILENGNSAIIDNPEYIADGTIMVDDVKNALGKLGRYYRENYLNNAYCIGITGSVGKTTTKEMVAVAFASKKIHKTAGNKNSLIGLPLTILEAPLDTEILILEAGMNQKGEIAILSEIAKPDIAIITNIGTAHIENMGNIENILKEKISIITGLRNNGKLILNGDDVILSGKQTVSNDIIYFACKNTNADYWADNIGYKDCSTVFTLHNKEKSVQIQIPTIGEHNVLNALAAYAAATEAGLDSKAIVDGLKSFISSGNRQRIYRQNDIIVIADCYNASPESMAAALAVLSLGDGRKVAVLGDMLELGEQSKELHARVGEYAAKNNVDILIAIGDFAKHIKAGFGKDCKTFGLNEKNIAADYINELLEPGDTVLFKASNLIDFGSLIKTINKIY
ncbi:MAG TPA: UDP-N-acetylmuramoyl-tripeptide--D-alanyl-D-alanine ligase [Clostridiales bacterium]|nr:UDP-N-acetylmuramoyl-tripeptide--D-alanyl-D-alanine ligase [Clostridiales bacterium]